MNSGHAAPRSTNRAGSLLRGLHGAAAPAAVLSALLVLTTGCRAPQSNPPASLGDAAPRDAWQQWRARRLQSIGGTNGWAALAGLHWLQEGANTAGTNPSNQVALQSKRLPSYIGRFVRNGTSVRFEAANGVPVLADDHPISAIQLQPDIPGPATTLGIGSVRMNLINRGENHERLAIRVRDPESPARRAFHGIECFNYDPAWRIAARFKPYPMPRRVRLDDVTGGTQVEISPGVLEFEVAGRTHRLEVLEDDEERDFFILFRDATTGKSTYGSGRFLHAPRPGADGRVILDFNFAYNPPCAYTAYATCPLPPRENRLPIAIPAGERFHGDHPSP